MFDEIGLPPFLDIHADGGGEVGPDLEQILKGFTRRSTFPELPVGGAHRRVHEPVAGQIHLEREAKRAAVVALPVCVAEVDPPVPSGMMGIELLGAPGQRQATLQVARTGEHPAKGRDGVAVHGVE